MAAARLDLAIPQGSVFEFTINVVGGPADLTGYTGRMQFRERREDIAPLAIVDPSNITVNPLTRQVTVRIPTATTSLYEWDRGVYDLHIVGSGADDWRIAEGRVTVSQSVTRGA